VPIRQLANVAVPVALRTLLRNNPGQNVHTSVPLSLGSGVKKTWKVTASYGRATRTYGLHNTGCKLPENER